MGSRQREGAIPVGNSRVKENYGSADLIEDELNGVVPGSTQQQYVGGMNPQFNGGGQQQQQQQGRRQQQQRIASNGGKNENINQRSSINSNNSQQQVAQKKMVVSAMEGGGGNTTGADVVVEEEQISTHIRELRISKEFTLAELATNADKMKYCLGDSPTSSLLNLFKPTVNGEKVGDLSKIVILGVRLLSASNTLPADLGVRIKGISDIEQTALDTSSNQSYNFFIHQQCNESYNDSPKELYLSNKLLTSMSEANVSLGTMTEKDLREMVCPFPGNPNFKTISKESTVGLVFQQPNNRHLMRIGDEMVGGNSPFMVVESEMAERCVQQIMARIKRSPTTDFKDFGVEFLNLKSGCTPIEGKEQQMDPGIGWKAIGQDLTRYGEAVNKKIMTQPHTVTICLEVKYVIADFSSAAPQQQDPSVASNATPSAPP